jgi:hypothetical protein
MIIKFDRWFNFKPMEGRIETGEGFLILCFGCVRLYFPKIEYTTNNDNLWFYV